MKNLSKLLIVLQIVFAFFSCEQQEVSYSDSISTLEAIEQRMTEINSEIGKIETAEWSEDYEKDETVADGGYDKEEIRAPQEYMDLILKKLQILEASYIPKRELKSTNSGTNVGVLAASSGCGTYDQITIYIDAEDSRSYNNDNKSNLTGWTGSSYKTGSGNVVIKYCIVPIDGFSLYKYADYMLLKVTASTIINTNTIYRHEDCEDYGPDNRFYLNDVRLSDGQLETLYGPNNMGRNVNLYYHHFPTDPYNGMDQFPYKNGIEYGVIGTIPGVANGNIYIDDQDGGNNNTLKVLYATGDNNPIFNDEIYHVIEGGPNTRIYTSKVK